MTIWQERTEIFRKFYSTKSGILLCTVSPFHHCTVSFVSNFVVLVKCWEIYASSFVCFTLFGFIAIKCLLVMCYQLFRCFHHLHYLLCIIVFCYVFATRQCRRRHYVFRLSVHPFVCLFVFCLFVYFLKFFVCLFVYLFRHNPAWGRGTPFPPLLLPCPFTSSSFALYYFSLFLFSFTLLIFFYCPSDPFLPE